MAENLSIQFYKKPKLDVLIEHARTTKWYILGVLLGLDISQLDDIKRENQDDGERLLKMYQLCLATNPNATYNDVIKALESKPLEELTVAADLRTFLTGTCIAIMQYN